MINSRANLYLNGQKILFTQLVKGIVHLCSSNMFGNMSKIPAIFGENLRYLVLKFGILVYKLTNLTEKSIVFSINCTYR